MNIKKKTLNKYHLKLFCILLIKLRLFLILTHQLVCNQAKVDACNHTIPWKQ